MCNLNVCMQVVNFNLWYYSSVLTDSPIKFTAFLLRKIDMICAWYISKLSDIKSNQDQLDQIASSWTKRKSNCVYVMIYWDQSILQLKPVYISASVTHSLCESDHWTSKKVYFLLLFFCQKEFQILYLGFLSQYLPILHPCASVMSNCLILVLFKAHSALFVLPPGGFIQRPCLLWHRRDGSISMTLKVWSSTVWRNSMTS